MYSKKILNQYLLESVELGDAKKVHEYLEKGADINLHCADGGNLLHVAARKGYNEIISLLMERSDCSYNKGLHNIPILGPLLSKLDIKYDPSAKDQSTTINVLSYIFNLNHNINARDETGKTPLHVASESGNRKTVELLLQKGADISSQDEAGKTPLHLASESGNRKTAELLLQKGADISSQDETGKTPLHLASKSGNYKTVDLLLNKGAYILSKDFSGKTPLHIAAQKGNNETILFLLSERASIDEEDENGETPLCLAAEAGHYVSTSLLLDMGADINGSGYGVPIVKAARCQKTEIISLLIKYGADINAKEYGYSALHIAARDGYSDVALTLLKHNADVDTIGNFMATPLNCSTSQGNEELMSILIKFGADAQCDSNFYGNPLYHAINYKPISTTSLILNVEESTINRLCSDSGLEIKELYEKSLLYKNGDENTPIEAKTFYLFMKINEIYLNYYKYISDKKFEKHEFSSKLFSDIKDTQKLIQDLKIKSPLIDDFSKLCECVFGSDECESLVPRLKFFAASKVFKDPDYYKDLLEKKELPQSIKLYVQELCEVTPVKYSKLEEVHSKFIGESSESIHEIE